MEVKDCPLELKELEGMECPRYTGVLKRGDTEVGWEGARVSWFPGFPGFLSGHVKWFPR